MIDYNGVHRGIDLLISDGVIECIGRCGCSSCREVECRDKIVYPCLSNPYIPLHDLIHRCGCIEPNSLVEEIAIESIMDGVTVVSIDSSMLDNGIDKCILEDIVSRYKVGINVLDDILYKPSLSSSDPLGELIDGVRSICKSYGRVYIPFLITRKEPFIYWRRYRVWPLQYLEENGFFDIDCRFLFIYLNWVSSMDIEVLTRHRDCVGVIVSPSKTMLGNVGGFTPVYELYSRGLWIGLSTSGLSDSLLFEARLLHMLYKYNYWDDRLGTSIVWKILLNNNDLYGVPKGVREGTSASIVVATIPFKPIEYSIESLFYNSRLLRVDYIVYRGETIYDRMGVDVE